jgi:hypothetical protein
VFTEFTVLLPFRQPAVAGGVDGAADDATSSS